MGTGINLLNSYAARDIIAGEKLLVDYRCFEWPAWLAELWCEYHEGNFTSERDHFSFRLQPGIAGYQVAYKVSNCEYGKGIFAEEDIMKGALIWKYKRGINVRSFKGEKETQAHLAKLPSDNARKYWLMHMFHYGGYCNEILDDNNLSNHSTDPNSAPTNPDDPISDYAIKNIKKGEQILVDYSTFEWPHWLIKLMEKHGAIDYYETSLL